MVVIVAVIVWLWPGHHSEAQLPVPLFPSVVSAILLVEHVIFAAVLVVGVAICANEVSV